MFSKKFFFLFTIHLLTILAGHAQIRAGVKGGVNLATWSIDPEFSGGKEAAILPHGGAFVNLDIHDQWSFQPEVLFSQKGLKRADNSIAYIFKINHIEVPLLAKFSFGNESAKGFLTAGPFIGYALSQRFVTREDGRLMDSRKVDFDTDLEADSIADRRVDAGWALGAGVQFATGPGDLFVELRYSYSLTGLFKYKGDRPDTTIRNKILMLSLGYLLPLKWK